MQPRSYKRIDHPAVGAVACPYCGALRGVPCRKKYAGPGSPYTETHAARVRKAEGKD